ncbi:histidine phosphatase superfamily [Aspergillus crustosus]
MFLPLPIAATLLGCLTTASAETILGVTVFSRHADRTSKHYHNPTLTNLGLQQALQLGSNYRDIYLSSISPKQILGISEDRYIHNQIFASSPDKPVYQDTATAFFQSFYPPLNTLHDHDASEQTLSNGTTIPAPLNGYQYVFLQSDSDSPNSIWTQGGDDCLINSNIADMYSGTAPYLDKVNAIRPFYQKFAPLLKNVTDITDLDSYLSFDNAYDIYDLLNTANIHNESMAGKISDQDLFQLRTLADTHEFNSNYDEYNPSASIAGRTLAGAMLNRINETIASNGTKSKFSLLVGGYTSMIQFFGIFGLTEANNDFYGLPDYASSMVFELFTEKNTTSFPASEEDLKVRFLFRNGSSPDSSTSLKPFRLFGSDNDHRLSSTSIPFTEFTFHLQQAAITSAPDWCSICSPGKPFCPSRYKTSPTGSDYHSSAGVSNATAGVIGAVVALVVVGGVGGGAFLVARRRLVRLQAVTMEAGMAGDKMKGFEMEKVKSVE